MERLFLEIRSNVNLQKSDAQLLFVGGHGGFVTYDGQGGSLVKKGGPIDRLFMLRNDGRIATDSVLRIDYGDIRFETGTLKGSVSRIGKSNRMRYEFEGNDDAVAILGSVAQLNFPPGTELVSGNVDPSVMVYVPGSPPTLPYVAFHSKVTVNEAILKWFGMPDAEILGAESGWDKIDPNPDPPVITKGRGIGFETQQHSAHLRVFLRQPLQ